MFLFLFTYKFLRWMIFPVLAVFTFLLTELLARNPDLVEKYYSFGIYPVIATVLSHFSSLFPFSLADLFYMMLVVLPILLVLLAVLRKISAKTAGKTALNVLAAGYIAFYFLWGFNYFRPGLNQRLGMGEQVTDEAIFLEVFENIIDQTNASFTDFENMDRDEIDNLVETSYKQWAARLNIPFPAGKRRPKPITFSHFFARAGISGYYGPFFSEVHINRHNLPVEYPFVLAHEKAHQLGITSEAEANFYAWLVCSHSHSKHLQYSANLVILRYFMAHGSQLEEYPEVIKDLHEPVWADLRRIRDHWLELRDETIDKTASRVNDAYLKSNKIEQGIQDYKGVVKFVMDFSADSLFQKQ